MIELLFILPRCEFEQANPLEQAHLIILHAGQVSLHLNEELLVLNRHFSHHHWRSSGHCIPLSLLLRHFLLFLHGFFHRVTLQ